MENTVEQDYMRIEIATLVKKLKLNSLEKGKFNIPVLMTTNENTTVVSSNTNIVNTASKQSKLDLDNYVELAVPRAFRMFFNEYEYIPKGTQFLVAFVGANVNDARIVGLYDMETYNNFSYSYYEFQEKFKNVVRRLRTIEHIHEIYNYDEPGRDY